MPRPQALKPAGHDGSAIRSRLAHLVVEEESWLGRAWKDSRTGATSGRGYHFQDAVGAWLASRLAAGELAADLLTPEGLDDFQLEGTTSWQVEVKSHQTRLGPFSLGAAAGHIADAWRRHAERFGEARPLVVVLENGMAGLDAEEARITQSPLESLVAEVDGLRKALLSQFDSDGSQAETLDALVRSTTLVTSTWPEIVRATEQHIGEVVPLPPLVLAVLARDLRLMVADASDANANPDYGSRTSLHRTTIVDELHSIADLVDLESLEYAVREGICSVIDMQPIAASDAYYEGISTEPGHVSAGLVVARPDLVADVVDGLGAGRPALLTGQSGAGKSAALWTLPLALPGVLWFRVHRLSESDVRHIERLLHAHNVSPDRPVGLLTDAAGRGDLVEWARLRSMVSRLPGAMLAGSARNEDLYVLGDLSDCKQIRVSLDEPAAARIHAGLLRRGVTHVQHWQEAFEQSEGLTLEFTHLLVRGQRLAEVVREQAVTRVREQRDLELRILALAATADRWSASVSIDAIETELGASGLQVRAAMARLVDEHLLAESQGLITGVHQVRSAAIVDAVHEVPPPLLQDTILSVLQLLSGESLTRFIFEVLKQQPDLESAILDAIKELSAGNPDSLVSCLRALELLDFHREASEWAEVADRCNVPIAQRPLVLQLAIMGTKGVELPGVFLVEFRTALDEIASLPPRVAARQVVLNGGGLGEITESLARTTDVGEGIRLLTCARGLTTDWVPLSSAFEADRPLTGLLAECEIEDFGECVAAARDVSVGLARTLVDSVGGVPAVLNRVREADPWIFELQVETVDGELTGVARYLFVSEEEQGEPRERSLDIARNLLRSLPDIEKVDVKPILPDGSEMRIGGNTLWSSGLLRRYDHGEAAVQWNRNRAQLTQALFGAPETERLAEFNELLEDTAKVVREFGVSFARSGGTGGLSGNLFQRCLTLSDRARQLSPPIHEGPLAGQDSSWMSSEISPIIAEICGNVVPRLHRKENRNAISAYLSETVLGKSVPRAREQAWRFLGFAGPPPVIDELEDMLSDLDAVLVALNRDPGCSEMIRSAARQSPSHEALARAAEQARDRDRTRIEERQRRIQSTLVSSGWDTEVHWIEGDRRRGEWPTFAVAVAPGTVIELPMVLSKLTDGVQALREPGEFPILVPVVRGKTITRYARKLIEQWWPITDPGDLPASLPVHLTERLVTRVEAAHSALVILSALIGFSEDGAIDSRLVKVAKQAEERYNTTVAEISSLGEDEVILEVLEWLLEVAERVSQEQEGQVEPGSVAADFYRSAFGNSSEVNAELEGALLLSLQWDCDQLAAEAD